MNLSITTRPPYSPSVEFVERKGAGHPDTICDELAERLARHLAAEYQQRTGRVQHFNVDKAVLAAGVVDVGFGGGTHVKPARLVLVGKADFNHGWKPDPGALADRFATELLDILPDADREAFDVEVWLNQSSTDLAAMLAGDGVPLANDTSFAAVSLPRSPLEDAVYRVEHHLNAPGFRREVPIGRDIKVMGARVEQQATLTVAVPVLASRVESRRAYDEVIRAVVEAASLEAKESFGDAVEVNVNQADQDNTPYLTLTGTSAEAGDDGQVGRGNRFGGLITPYRPMSLEAAAGKNPAAHVGKTYHATGSDIAHRLLDETPARETTVRMLSSIGRPVTDPQAVHVEVSGEHHESAHIAKIVEECLADWEGVQNRLIAGEYELF